VINTSFEAIEKLLNQTKVLKPKVGEVKKQVVASVKSAASSANMADEVQKQSDLLSKRIAKLEQK
jgi:hypothetical protein